MSDIDRRTFLTGHLVGAALAAITVGRPLTAREVPTTRFLAAVHAGDLERVRESLGTDPGLIHARDEAGRSAFAVALLAGHPGVADLLRERGHEPDLVESALALDWERFETLAKATPEAVNQDHPVGGSALYAAALGGAGTSIWRPYAFGADPNRDPLGRRGFTPLRAALEHGDLAIAELTAATLVGNGADPNGLQPGGSSPLHAAAARGSLALTEILIRKGAALTARDARGRTPLDLAEEKGHRAVAKLLREHRRIPRDHSTSRWAYTVDGSPYRPPDLSAFSVVTRSQVVGAAHFDLEGTRTRVERHPELARAVATTTEAAVEACAHTGRLPIVDLLLEHGAPCSLPTAVMRDDLARAKELLEEDPLRIHERGAHDFALLWYPVIGGGLLEMAELLLSRGAEVERQHHLGTTALHFAARSGQREMAALLLEHGADPDRRGRKFGGEAQSPLALALEAGHDEVVKLLRERGAKG